MKQEIEAKKLQEEREKADREKKLAEKYEAKKQQDIQNFIAFCAGILIGYQGKDYNALKEKVQSIVPGIEIKVHDCEHL